MSYINRNESAFKCFESMRNTQEKEEDYALHIFGRNKVDFFLALFFSLLLGMLIGVDKK